MTIAYDGKILLSLLSLVASKTFVNSKPVVTTLQTLLSSEIAIDEIPTSRYLKLFKIIYA